MRRARIDFSPYFLIIVTLILFGLFAASLYSTLDGQELKIGEKQASMAETYERARLIRFTLDHEAERRVDLATQDFIALAGLPREDCGSSGSFTYWNTPNQSCVPDQEYQTYYAILAAHMKTALGRVDEQHGTRLANKDYAYYADNERVVGIPDQPESLPIQSANDPIPITAFGITVKTLEGGVRANIGWYNWMPTINVPINPGITDISSMRTLYTTIRDQCKYLAPVNQTACVTHQASVTGMNATVTTAPGQYYHLTIPSTAKTQAGPASPYRIGIYLEPPVTS